MNRLLIVCFIIFSWNNIILAQTWKENLIEARNLYHQKNYDEALIKYKLVEKTAPKSISISNEIAQTAYKSKKFEAAEKNYSSSKSKNEPSLNYSKTQHNLGNSKYKQKKYQDAIDSYKESLRNNPNNEQTRYNLAKAMLSKKQDDKKENENKKKQENKKQDKQRQDKQKQDKQKQKDKSPKPSNQIASKLNDKKTDRMLDELMKKEMDTKKKMDKSRGNEVSSKSGIDW